MSLLIRGMEMPTTCRDCRLSTFTDFDSMPFCNITMDDICLNDWETKRCDNCPLIPVPPHGRLGNLDALYSHIKDEQRKCNDPYDGWSECQVALGFVNTAPTIIESEE